MRKTHIQRLQISTEKSPWKLLTGEVVTSVVDGTEYIVTETGELVPRFNYRGKCRTCEHRLQGICTQLYNDKGKPLDVSWEFFCGHYSMKTIQVDDTIIE